jgi:cytochrome o ubiquinol oxidase operon protein cyoD
MSENLKEHTPASSHHGSVRSYVIGFLLSLAFTIVPYLMVRTQTTTDRVLLLSILGFAVVQMFVQIFFFLHLGRGPKPLYNVIFFTGTAGMIVLVVGASLLIMDNLYRNMSPTEVTTRLAQDENIAEIGGKETGACQGNNATHEVIISSKGVNPGYIEARRCDTLTFKSEGDVSYELMFGPHDSPSSYGGLYEVPVRVGRSKILTLNEVGDFSFHDRSDHDLMGRFSVKP